MSKIKIRSFTDISRIDAIISEWSHSTGLLAYAVDSDGVQLTQPGVVRRRNSSFSPIEESAIQCCTDFSLDITLENGTVVGKIIGGRVLPIHEDSPITERSHEDMSVSASMLRRMVSLVVNSCYADYLYNTEIKVLNEQLRLDPMTRIYTKNFMNELIYDAIESGDKGALFVIDIDDFKHINDSYGHSVGDEVIIAIADTLKDIFGADNYVSRFGGDEFTAYVNSGLTREEYIGIGKQVCEAVRNLRFASAPECRASLSIGIAPCPACGNTIDELFLSADNALYKTKETGKDGCSFAEAENPVLV
ncbi:MAG: GGDEF domain-containing protein [Oscillospiraceae bacterium]